MVLDVFERARRTDQNYLFSYRTRIRTPSFIHIQAIPFLSRGLMLADFTAVVATTDFVMADVDK
jgi:NADH-quinone oxidoreductase subunit C/D